jgi:hypothetical protein
LGKVGRSFFHFIAMHDQEEVNALIWEALASKGQALTIDSLVVETGLSRPQIASALGRLRETQLISVHEVIPTTFLATIMLDAWRWAQAVDLGIPLGALERFASLPAREKRDALRMAGRGDVDAAKHRKQEDRATSRREILKGRAASKAAATDLARLAEDARAAYQSALDEKLDATTCSLLGQVLASAQASLDRLRQALEEA